MQRFAFLRLGAGYASPSYRQGTGERELGGKGIETSGPSVSFQAFLTQFFLGEGGPESLRALPVARPSGPAVGPPAFAPALRGSGRWLPRAAAVGGRQRARGARVGGGRPLPSGGTPAVVGSVTGALAPEIPRWSGNAGPICTRMVEVCWWGCFPSPSSCFSFS